MSNPNRDVTGTPYLGEEAQTALLGTPGRVLKPTGQLSPGGSLAKDTLSNT